MAIPDNAKKAISEITKAIKSCKTQKEGKAMACALRKAVDAVGIEAGIEDSFAYFFDGFRGLPGGVEGFEKAQALIVARKKREVEKRKAELQAGPRALAA